MQIWYKGCPPETSLNESEQFQQLHIGNGGNRAGGELFFGRANGIVSPLSKVFLKIFENFAPQIPGKGSEMKQGHATEGQITAAGWSAISKFSRI
jgi:hypothetical protein